MNSEPAVVPAPTSEEARNWVGCRVDDVAGSRVGQARGVFADAKSGEPTWLVTKLSRFAGPLVAIPMSHCAGTGKRVWVAHPRHTIRTAPVVDPTRALLREHELTICAHYGIGEEVGRAADVTGRPGGTVTSQPA
jgi:hypothetical protein